MTSSHNHVTWSSLFSQDDSRDRASHFGRKLSVRSLPLTWFAVYAQTYAVNVQLADWNEDDKDEKFSTNPDAVGSRDER
jgi:hypothetical protein